MLETIAAEVWYQQHVYVPIGYLLAGVVLALFVPANQLIELLVSKLPGEYELRLKERK